jgi:hypothetical protein
MLIGIKIFARINTGKQPFLNEFFSIWAKSRRLAAQTSSYSVID